ncbi:hypothetical protein Tco_0592584, partial [Tanacetum coccineum]
EHNEMLLDVVVQSANNFGCFTNRGDEFDEEYAYQLAAGERHLIHIENGYYDELQMDDMDNDYESDKRKHQARLQYKQQDVPEPVDFKNNGVLWLPPEPEDEEDEREALLFDGDDDDDVDAVGEWGYIRSSSNLRSEDYRIENLVGVEDEDDKDSWLEIITSLSREAASLLKPDKIYLPPSKLVFKYENQEWIQNEVNEVVGRAELLFSKILNALTQMAEKKFGKTSGNSSANMPPSRRQLADLEEMLQKEKAEFEESLQKVLNQEGKKDQPMIDILEINHLRRQLLFQSYVWDHRLVHAASVNINSPRDDINDLILKKIVRPNKTLVDVKSPVDSDASENVDMKQFELQVSDKESEVVVDSSPKE